MNLTKTLADVAPLHPSNFIATGNVYVGTKPDGGAIAAELEDGKKAVLQTKDGAKLELTTRNTIGGNPGATGTYLSNADYYSLNNRTKPQLRRYKRSDTFAKVRSSAGVLLLLPALLALLTAASSLFFLLSSQGQTPTTAVAAQAQAIVSWVSQPGTARASTAQACLLRIEGQQLPQITIPGVTCAPPTTPWWRSTLTGSLLTAGIALLAALVGIFGLPSHYAFRKNPAVSS